MKTLTLTLVGIGLTGLCWATPLYADIYTWLDDDGRTVYGDTPPENEPVRKLPDAADSVSTIGASALRQSELDLLAQLREAERQRVDRESETRPAVSVVVVAPPRRTDEEPGRYLVRGAADRYLYPYRHGYGRSHYRRSGFGVRAHYRREGLDFGLNYDAYPPRPRPVTAPRKLQYRAPSLPTPRAAGIGGSSRYRRF